MSNAVFNSVESYFSKNRLKSNVPFSKFDLSHIRSMDIDFGILYPFWIEDCLPGDRFKISNVLKLQALPLKNPLFNNIKLYTYYFYVPYYLLWHKFDRFISGGRDGTFSAELPVIHVNSSNLSKPLSGDVSERDTIFGFNTLWDYLGFEPIRPVKTPDGLETVYHHSFDVSAFPFAAYQRIFRDYFMNQDVQTNTNVNNWFPEDDLDFELHDGVNSIMGEGSLSPADASGDYNYRITESDVLPSYPSLLALRARNFNKDYFTSSMFSPQRGPMQAIGSNSSLVSNFVAADGLSPSFTTPLNISEVSGSQKFSFIDADNKTYGNTVILDTLSRLVSTGNFSVSDLHLAQQIELWMERNMSVKAQYNEFLRIHFTDAPLDERLTKPYYIGGTVQNVIVSQVMQTSQTTETSAQGTLTGNASSFDSDYVGTFHSHEYGLIMGICCIMPESYYEHGLDRHWTKTSRYDFYFPEFCDLEPQAILRKEYDARNTSSDSWLDQPLSFIGRYDEYRHHRSLAVGSLRNPDTSDFKSWVIPRVNPYYNVESNVFPPMLTSSLICTHRYFGVFSSPSKSYDAFNQSYRYLSLVSHDAWDSGYAVNPFILQIGISCTAVRPLPYVPDPSRNSY